MAVWVSWVIGIVSLILAVMGAVKVDRRVTGALVRASKNSWVRAVGVLVAHELGLVILGTVATLIVILVRREMGMLVGAVLTGIFFAALVPFTVSLMPVSAGASVQSADLRREENATPGVSRVLGFGGAVLWFITVLPFGFMAMLGFGLLRE